MYIPYDKVLWTFMILKQVCIKRIAYKGVLYYLCSVLASIQMTTVLMLDIQMLSGKR